MKNDISTLRMVLSSVGQLGGQLKATEIIQHVRSHNAIGTSDATIRNCLVNLSVNHASRWTWNKQPRTTDAGHERDKLFYNHSSRTYELYDPKIHGVWGIRQAARGRYEVYRVAQPSRTKTPASSDHGGFMRPLWLTPALEAIVGSATLDRLQITRKIWEYIQLHGLQDASDKKMINADGPFSALLAGAQSVDMFKMTKLVAKHCFETEELLLRHLAQTPTDPVVDIELFAPSLAALATTERDAIVKSRIGQGIFRENVGKLWGWRCAATAVSIPAILRASHVKPWRCCTNQERLDPYNGLLLVPNLDVLFDKGLITFTTTGEPILSSSVSPDDANVLGVGPTMRLRQIHKKTVGYLAFHRANVFAS